MKLTNKTSTLLISFILLFILHSNGQDYIDANNPKIQYTGRIDFTNSLQPQYSFPGVSIKTRFNGTGISAIIHDYGSDGVGTTNYYKVIIDNSIVLEQLKMNNGKHTYILASNLALSNHTVEIIKITEGASGVSSFIGFKVTGGNQNALDLPDKPNKRIEFIGDSWTCGYGNLSQFATGSASMANSGYVAKNEDNYYAWGPITARALGAEYHVTAISGKGLYRNNWDQDNTGNATGTLPKNYDNIIEDNNSISYDHSFHPDIVSIHLGTNDMAAEGEVGQSAMLDDVAFQNTYKNFIDEILSHHPCANVIICYGNSKSDGYPSWTQQLTRLRTIANNLVALYPEGNVAQLELPYTAESWPAQPDDCGYGDAWHPSLCSHQEMSNKLVEKINGMNVNWGTSNECTSVNTTNTITNLKNNTVSVFPNPAINHISVVGNNIDQWKISNQLGEIVLNGTEKHINISKLNTGIYCFLSLSNGQITSTKFIKK